MADKYFDSCPECGATVEHEDEGYMICGQCESTWKLCPDCGNWEMPEAWSYDYGVCDYCAEGYREETDAEECNADEE